METRTLIKDTATVARVTQLTEGDAYRRLIAKTTYQQARMVVGVITGVMNNGETLVLTALEVDEVNRYGNDSPVKQQIFEADADLTLFPVVAGEAEEILSAAQDEMRQRVEDKRKDLETAKDRADSLDRVVRLIDLAQRADVEAAQTPSITDATQA